MDPTSPTNILTSISMDDTLRHNILMFPAKLAIHTRITEKSYLGFYCHGLLPCTPRIAKGLFQLAPSFYLRQWSFFHLYRLVCLNFLCQWAGMQIGQWKGNRLFFKILSHQYYLNLNNCCYCIKHNLSLLQKKSHTERYIILHTCSKALIPFIRIP